MKPGSASPPIGARAEGGLETACLTGAGGWLLLGASILQTIQAADMARRAYGRPSRPGAVPQ